MNELRPGSCTFPTKIDSKEWMAKEFNQGIYDLFGINSWEDLKKGPVKAKMHPAAWHDLKFGTPSEKYEFKSELAEKWGNKALPEYVAPRPKNDKYRLLTPHTKFGLHSQFVNLDWSEEFNPEPFVYIHPELAAEKNIEDGNTVRVFNSIGEVITKAKISTVVPADAILMYEAWFKNNPYNVQNVVDDTSSDMGAYKTGQPGVAIHDQFADVAKV